MSVRLLTKRDLAARVQCHQRTIDNLLASDSGPAVTRIGRMVRVREDDFTAWLDQHRTVQSSSGGRRSIPLEARATEVERLVQTGWLAATERTDRNSIALAVGAMLVALPAEQWPFNAESAAGVHG